MSSIKLYLEKILDRADLTFEEAQDLLDKIFEGEVAEVQIAAFLAAMRVKRATATEIAGLANSLRKHAVAVKVDIENMIDTCGTGGAKVKVFNVSTAAALVAAGAGVYVAKHGNRAITSKSGSADVLTELGVKIDATPDLIAECIKQARIGFMFAPLFHPAMKYVQPIRKSLEFRTVFNILGPLANPAAVTAQVMGVADENLMERIIQTLKILGTKRAMVVHSDGLDEISTLGSTKIAQLTGEKITHSVLNPEDYGIPIAKIDSLRSKDAAANAAIIKDILSGKNTGPAKDIVILNAAAAIIVGSIAENFDSAIKIADNSIKDGKAMQCLEKMIIISNS